jgi:hypothetical protein
MVRKVWESEPNSSLATQTCHISIDVNMIDPWGNHVWSIAMVVPSILPFVDFLEFIQSVV